MDACVVRTHANTHTFIFFLCAERKKATDTSFCDRCLYPSFHHMKIKWTSLNFYFRWALNCKLYGEMRKRRSVRGVKRKRSLPAVLMVVMLLMLWYFVVIAVGVDDMEHYSGRLALCVYCDGAFLSFIRKNEEKKHTHTEIHPKNSLAFGTDTVDTFIHNNYFVEVC